MSAYSKRLPPQTWPQDTLQIPNAAGRFMPPVEKGNVDIARQEAFTMSGSFVYDRRVDGAELRLMIPTDQDGDFWVDQIYMVTWWTNEYKSIFPSRGTLKIKDVRTGRSLNYPDGIPLNFLNTLVLFPDDAGFDPANSPPPDGFRSTSTLPQPFCFTRQGGIDLTITWIGNSAPTGVVVTTDIAFGGWKEYTYAARGQGV